MFSRRLIRVARTLAFRLTLLYAGIFTVSTCLAFLLFYLLITAPIREQIDQELIDQLNRFSTLLTVEDIDTVQRVAIIESQAAGVKKLFFRLLYPNGVVFSSSNMS